MISPQDYDRFKELVEADDRDTETACQPFLAFAGDLLLGRTPAGQVTVERENRNDVGISDVIVVASIENAVGVTERKMVLWEVKSPQAKIFTRSTQNRFGPSRDLVEAENQLLHYTYAAQGSQVLRDHHHIVSPNDIRPGGIIIGRKRSWLPANVGERDREVALSAFRMRQRYFYGQASIEVRTWDDILAFVAPS